MDDDVDIFHGMMDCRQITQIPSTTRTGFAKASTLARLIAGS